MESGRATVETLRSRACAPMAVPALAVLALGVVAGPVAAQSSVRVVAYNIKHGRGMDDRVDLARIADVLGALDADVITLQEVDDRTERTGRVDQVAVLAEHLSYHGFHGPHRPYEGGWYGNAVVTRLPVRGVTTHPIPPASGSALSVLEVEVELPEGGSLSVVSVHLAGTTDERLAQADAVTGLFGALDHPVVLAGDFNGRPGGPVLKRLGLEWGTLPKSGDPFTYPADAPDREIDFVLVRPSDRVEVVGHRVIAEPLASDHRPILAELRFPARKMQGLARVAVDASTLPVARELLEHHARTTSSRTGVRR